MTPPWAGPGRGRAGADKEDEEPVQLERAECVHATERAIQVRFEDGRTLWVPQSCVTDDSEVYALGHTGRLEVAGWWARKQGLGE